MRHSQEEGSQRTEPKIVWFMSIPNNISQINNLKIPDTFKNIFIDSVSVLDDLSKPNVLAL